MKIQEIQKIKKSKSTQTTLTLLDIDKMMNIASITHSDGDDASSDEYEEDNDVYSSDDEMEVEEAILSDDDMGLLHEEALILIDEFIKSNPLLFSSADFETIVYDHVQSILHFSINYRRYDDDDYADENEDCDEDENETVMSCQIDELIIQVFVYKKVSQLGKNEKKTRILRDTLSARAKNRRVVFTPPRAHYSQFGLESVWFTVCAKSANIRKMHAI